MPTIRVTIDKFGQPTIKAEGFVGNKCALATAPIEDALKSGANVKKDRTPEFYQTVTGRQAVTNRG